jgi:isoleucyl-tRNA synthetase
VAAAIASCDASKLAADLAAGRQVTLDVPEVEGGKATIGPDDVIISERPRQGWSVVNEQGETVALDLEITPELARAGLSREAVRFIQDTRKHVGLEVSDRISLSWHAAGQLAEAIRDHAGEIAEEVLATSMAEAEPGDDWATEPDLGLSIRVVKA